MIYRVPFVINWHVLILLIKKNIYLFDIKFVLIWLIEHGEKYSKLVRFPERGIDEAMTKSSDAGQASDTPAVPSCNDPKLFS